MRLLPVYLILILASFCAAASPPLSTIWKQVTLETEDGARLELAATVDGFQNIRLFVGGSEWATPPEAMDVHGRPILSDLWFERTDLPNATGPDTIVYTVRVPVIRRVELVDEVYEEWALELKYRDGKFSSRDLTRVATYGSPIDSPARQ